MDSNKESKRKKDKHSDSDDYRSERRTKKRRSRSRTPNQARDNDSRRKRKHSKSRSPLPFKQERRRNDAQNEPEKSVAPARKPKETDMLNTRTGGAYIPPARLRMMQAQITDKSSPAYQRLAWEALKKSIHGHINKINVGNIGIIIKQLLKENIVRGRGLLCRSVIQAQAASPTFTNVYAALVAAVNSRFPNIGELLLKRLVIQFKRGFKRNDKPICISSASFIAHLVNQRVAHEILALELLTLLVETPTDDSVEVAIAFLKECGQKLTEVSSKGVNAIFEMLRNILHEGQLDKRVQYMIEVMFQVWKDGFKDHPAVLEELELVQEEEQFTHLLMLDDATDAQDILNVFKFDEKYEENEDKYKALSNEILGSDAESGEEGSDEDGSEESDEDEEDKEKAVTIIDNTETNLVALRRTIYLTINSSLDFEECAHKLMKMQLKPGQEIELCHMFLDCCAEQRTYEKFYGLLAQRFCNINRIYISPFEEIFKDSYSTAHRLDTNRLRNVSKFFAHLLFTDSISWEALECVKLNEEDTTSSSRIYIKILFQELAEYMGLKKLNDRLQDPTLQMAFSGIFPRDNPKNTRFSINFFTSIGLGGLTDELREHLKQMPKNVPAAITEIKLDSSSSSSSSSDSSSSDSSSSESEEDGSKKKTEKKGKKDKREKSKKTPKTPEVEDSSNQNDKVERWGHDGFYDTYGPGARRDDSRPNRERDGNTREMQSSRHNNDERDRYNDGNRNNRERDRREDRRKDPQGYRRETERDIQNESRYRQNDDRRKNNDELDRKRDDRDSRNERSDNTGYEESTRNHNDRDNHDRYNNKDIRNRQEKVDDQDNDQRRGRDRDYDQSNRRNDDRDLGRERRGHNDKPYEREEATRSRDDRNYNDDNRKSRGDHDQSERNDDRSSRNERNNRDDRNNGDRYNQEPGKRYYDFTSERSGNNKQYERDESRYSNRESRNNDDRYNKDSRNQINDDDDPRKTSRKDNNKTNRYDDDDRDRRNNVRDENKNSYDDNRQTERIRVTRDVDNNELDKRRQEKDSRYSKRDDETQKTDRRTEKSKNYDNSDDEQNEKRKSKKDRVQNDRESRDDVELSIKANKENEKRKEKNKERNDGEEDSRHKRSEDHKKDKSKRNKKDKSKSKKKDKRTKKKDKENFKYDSDTSDSSDSSDSSGDSKNAGGRYWDTFDIASKETSTKLLLGGTPEKSGKYYEQKRKR
ncbi:pre-mRNA-splicing factor CWC22 homolog [Maniola hyperantus]|uniref:pre-mRNA-splicing factor CWC22 homolog n=1 Tax=Aphantopus hyperantus TaxID=2795564 RepID=UPI00156963EB|nr:pre-mRNA-splicing factor CWC22 homolog [Maniola hyperantus]